MITQQQLEIVLAVEETGSLNKAAEKLYISQPAVSIAIKNLENELGVSLFTRKSSGTQLSAIGQMIMPYIHETIDNMNKIQSTCTEYYLLNQTNIKDLSITLYAPPFFGSVLFPRVIAKFKKLLPKLKINTKNLTFEQFERPLKPNEFVLYTEKQSQKINQENFSKEHSRHQIVLLSPNVRMHKNRASKYNGFILEEELIQLPIITIHSDNSIGAVFSDTYIDYLKSLNPELNIIECSNTNVANSLCTVDEGVTIGIRFADKNLSIDTADTVVVPLRHNCPETFYLASICSVDFPEKLTAIIHQTILESAL